MHKLTFFLGSVLFLVTYVQAEITPRERAKHFAKGTAKVLVAASNIAVIVYKRDLMLGTLYNFAYKDFLSNYAGNRDKLQASGTELICQSLIHFSLGYVAYKFLKSSIFNFKRAFENERVIKRSP